jgi:hypothetical protein
MAITAHSRHTGFTPEKHDEAMRRLDAGGHRAPVGRLEHVAFEADGEIEVIDIWESQQALEACGPEGFVPILLDLGVELRPEAQLAAATRRRGSDRVHYGREP